MVSYCDNCEKIMSKNWFWTTFKDGEIRAEMFLKKYGKFHTSKLSNYNLCFCDKLCLKEWFLKQLEAL